MTTEQNTKEEEGLNQKDLTQPFIIDDYTLKLLRTITEKEKILIKLVIERGRK